MLVLLAMWVQIPSSSGIGPSGYGILKFFPVFYFVEFNEFWAWSVRLQLLVGLLGVESGQDAVIRTYLYERGEQVFKPYNVTVAEMTTAISALRNQLAGCGIRDEGIFVPLKLGAENRTTSNILSANAYSISYARTQEEILRIVYGTGKENVPGLFFPDGANGKIARRYLHKHE